MTDSVTKKGCPKIHIDTSFLCEPVRSQEGERRNKMQKKERKQKSMSRKEQICETCKENDNGFCDRIGRMVEDDDWCAKWKTKEVPEWKARMMNTFLAGH